MFKSNTIDNLLENKETTLEELLNDEEIALASRNHKRSLVE